MLNKKFILLLILGMLTLNVLGCTNADVKEYDPFENIVEQVKDDLDEGKSYMFINVEEFPEGWTKTDYSKYCFHVDTKVVYCKYGDDTLVPLVSKEYRMYIYNEESNEFVGVE